MMLEDKTAVLYGGGGAIGGAAARAFTREHAHVHLAGRCRLPARSGGRDIPADGGTAEVAHLDALDEAAVQPAPTPWQPEAASTSLSTPRAN